MFVSLPDTTVGTVRFQVTVPTDPHLVTGIRLTNESNTVLPVRINGQLRNLEPWTQDVWLFPARDFSNPIIIDAPQLLQPPLIPGATLKAEAALNETDPYPGVYPQQLSRQVSGLAGWTSVGTLVTSGGTQTLTTSAVPPTTKSLCIAISGSVGLVGLQVNGHSATQVVYLPLNTGTQAVVGIIIIPVNAAIDTQYDIIVTPVSPGVIVAAFASDIAVPLTVGNVAVPQTVAIGQVIGNVLINRYTGQGRSAPAVGTKATVTLAAVASQRWVCDYTEGQLFSTTSVAGGQGLYTLIDGVSGGVNILLDDIEFLAAAAAAVAPHVPFGPGGRFANAGVNTAMTAEWNAAPPANQAQRATIGAYTSLQ